VDYDEPEEPAAFSPLEEDNYSKGDVYPAQGDGPEDQNDNTDDFPAYPAEGSDSVGGKRSQIVLRGETSPEVHEERRRRKPSANGQQPNISSR
jgi:hypothetical protein